MPPAESSLPKTGPPSARPRAGWYADPRDPAVERWWDGTRWFDVALPHAWSVAVAAPPTRARGLPTREPFGAPASPPAPYAAPTNEEIPPRLIPRGRSTASAHSLATRSLVLALVSPVTLGVATVFAIRDGRRALRRIAFGDGDPAALSRAVTGIIVGAAWLPLLAIYVIIFPLAILLGPR